MEEKSYWMQPRSTRRLEVIKDFIERDTELIVGKKWRGNRVLQKKRDEVYAEWDIGLDKKVWQEGQSPGGGRTDVALMGALGFYAINPDGILELTEQGERLLRLSEYKFVILEQLLQYRYPSPYSKKIKISSDFNIFPFRFILRLLMHQGLADNGGMLIDDNVPRLSQDELALFVIPSAKKDSDIEAIVRKISNYREASEKAQINQSYKDIANTFINNLDSTGIIERTSKSIIELSNCYKDVIYNIMEVPPRTISLSPGEEYIFQLEFGKKPDATIETFIT